MIEGRNIFVSGRTGTGKTYLLLQQIAALPRLFVYQPKRDDHDYPGVYFDAAAGERDAMFAWWKHCELHGRRFRIVYRPKNPFDLLEFAEISLHVHRCHRMGLVCEEMMQYLCGYDPKKPGHEGVTTLLTDGRTPGITTWLVTQRPVQIPHLITSQARQAYLFATHEPAEVIYIRQAFGTAAADKLQQLGEHEHVIWHEDGNVEVGKA